MLIKSFTLYTYEFSLITGVRRQTIFIHLVDSSGNESFGEIAPLPLWSRETLENALSQLQQIKKHILDMDWHLESYLRELAKLDLFPSVVFGLESALLSLLSPLSQFTVNVSALFMGTAKEIMQQAQLRHQEGYTSAKLKVSILSFKEAAQIIHELKNTFSLRIDVNRAWKTKASLQFFEMFPLDTFDYVEEPFETASDLALFPHPLAVDESFPTDLSLKNLEKLPSLKALIYKPTLQGGMAQSLYLKGWTEKKGLKLILSSSFESDKGLIDIAALAQRLAITDPLGLGTYHFLKDFICFPPLQFADSKVVIAAKESLKNELLQKLSSDYTAGKTCLLVNNR